MESDVKDWRLIPFLLMYWGFVLAFFYSNEIILIVNNFCLSLHAQSVVRRRRCRACGDIFCIFRTLSGLSSNSLREVPLSVLFLGFNASNPLLR